MPEAAVPTMDGPTRSRPRVTKAAVLGGGLLIAIFVLVAWGALRDAASAEAGPAGPPVASVVPGSVQRPAATAPGIAPSIKAGGPAAATAAAPATKGHAVAPGRANAAARTMASARPLAVVKPHLTVAPVTARTVAKALPAAAPRPSAPSAPRLAGKGAATGAAIIPPSVNQCNGSDNVGGQAVACVVTVTNNLDLTTGATSSTVTTNDCHGAAGAPPTCTTTTTTSNQLVSSITQCDGSGNGGGSTVTCAVHIVNNITGATTLAPVTVNQCIGSGTGGVSPSGPTLLCSPTGATTGADITQCDGSGNGGGAPIRVQCTVTPSTQASALPVSVNQCNQSGNGGGGLVTCSVSVVNNLLPVVAVPPGSNPVGPPPVAVQPGVPPAVTPPGVGPPGVPRIVVAGFSPATPVGLTSRGTTNLSGNVPAIGLSTGSPSLARTGFATSTLALVSLLAMLLGGLLLGLSKRSAGRLSR